MKKLFEVLAICCLSVLLLVACGGSSSIKVTGQNGAVYKSYQEACEANDFEAAHRFANELDSYDAYDYVFQKEAMYLLSLDDRQAEKRLIILLSEQPTGRIRHDGRCDFVTMMSIDLDNKDFVKTLTKQYQSSIDEKSFNKLYDYLTSQENDNNLELLMDLAKRTDEMKLLFSRISSTLDAEGLKQFIKQHPTAIDISKDFDMLSRLASLNDKEISASILTALAALESKTITWSRESGGTFDAKLDKHGNSDVERHMSYYKFYRDEVDDYNKICMNVLNIAISNQNKYLASQTLNYFKPNFRYTTTDVGGEKTKISVFDTDDDIKKAKAAYNEAVKSGVLK